MITCSLPLGINVDYPNHSNSGADKVGWGRGELAGGRHYNK